MTTLNHEEIDLDGLDSYNRARVMVDRPDCPIDLIGLDSYDRAWVMSSRPDCLVNLTGLNSGERALVMENRPDCPPDKLIAERIMLALEWCKDVKK